jgi:hypothetical protein
MRPPSGPDRRARFRRARSVRHVLFEAIQLLIPKLRNAIRKLRNVILKLRDGKFKLRASGINDFVQIDDRKNGYGRLPVSLTKIHESDRHKRRNKR